MAMASGCLAYWLLASGIADGRWWWQTRALRDWQQVPCRIEEHWIEGASQRADLSFKQHLRYTFSWQSRSFQGDRFSFSEVPTIESSDREAVVKYPSELDATCWINPQDPRQAVLIAPTVPDSFRVTQLFLCVLLGLLTAVIALCASVGVISSLMLQPQRNAEIPGLPPPLPRWSPLPRKRGRRLIDADSKPWSYSVGRWFGAVVNGKVRPPTCKVWCHTTPPRTGEAITVSWDCRSHTRAQWVVRLVAREEVRLTQVTDHVLHMHQLVAMTLGHGQSGRETVTLPITQPPAWQGNHDQISWAIEVEAQNPSGPLPSGPCPSGPCSSGISQWRFPILIESPPRLHMTSAALPAERNSPVANSLTMALPIAEVKPGEAIAGTLTWKRDRAPRFLELRLICCCSGVAGTEERLAAACRLERPTAEGRSGFQLQHPGAPLSWQGTLMATSWRIDAVADEQVFAAMDLTVVASQIPYSQ